MSETTEICSSGDATKWTLRARDFARLSQYIYDTCGIKMPEAKKTLLETRLQRRVRDMGLTSFSQYCDHLFSGQADADELVRMIDLITTNKTDFFREPNHFEFLVQNALPELARRTGAGIDRPLRVWSAGCSTGEEPYTLAMVLTEYAEAVPGFRFRILATDISTRVLKAAVLATYDQQKIAPIPMPLKRKYLLRSRDRDQGLVRIAPEIRGLVTFRHLNFMDSEYDMPDLADVVFCRNVIIYFDRPTQEQVMGKIGRCIARGGYLFMGHSETLFGLNVAFQSLVATVYRNP